MAAIARESRLAGHFNNELGQVSRRDSRSVVVTKPQDKCVVLCCIIKCGGSTTRGLIFLSELKCFGSREV